jgi:hypothetical protein
VNALIGSAAAAPPGLLTWVVLAAVVLVLVLVVVGAGCVARARRLDRLHRRTDAARAGLADALEWRGQVALRVADLLAAGAPGERSIHGRASSPRPGHRDVEALRAAARNTLATVGTGLRTPGAAPPDRAEVAANSLTRRLAEIEPAGLSAEQVAELADAEQGVVLARRVYNDAVRDTLALRSRRLVRLLRLAGTAPPPVYFEIADPEPRRPTEAAPKSVERPAVTRTGPASR